MDPKDEKNVWKNIAVQELERRKATEEKTANENMNIVRKLNTNNYVKVKLTEKGEKIYKEYYNAEPRKYENGYTYFQLWILMKVFGQHMKLGEGPEFEGNCIFIEEKELEKEK